MKFYVIGTVDSPCWDQQDVEDEMCPACGESVEMGACPGHGEIGDPDGHEVLQEHEEGIHARCKHDLVCCHSGQCGIGQNGYAEHADERKFFEPFVNPAPEEMIPPVYDDATEWFVMDDQEVLGGEGDYAYLARESSHENERDSSWYAHHSLQVEGVISEEVMDKFTDEGGWHAQDIHTLGSLTAFGAFPAVPFRLDSQSSIGSMYATPVPEMSDECWPLAATRRDLAYILHTLGFEDLPGFECDGGWSVVRAEVLRKYES